MFNHSKITFVSKTQTIHGTGIFTYIWLKFIWFIGMYRYSKYTSPIDDMGKGTRSIFMEKVS